jgi:hypothetical protein
MKLKLDENGAVVLADGKPVYVHDDGKEVPFDAAGAVSKISQLNREAQSHRERAETAESSLKAFEGITDPAAARKALETVKNYDDKKLIDAGEVERIKSEAIKAVEDKYKPVVQEAEALKSQLDSHLIGGAFARSKFIAEKFAAEGPAGVEIAQALFANRLKVEGGRVVAYDANGEKLYSRARPGELADTEEAIELLVDAYPHKAALLRGTGASGGGAAGGGGKASKTFNEMTEAEHVALFNKNPEEFKRLRAAATAKKE